MKRSVRSKVILRPDTDRDAAGKLRREFLMPGKEFTPFPFWFWNDALDEAELKRQMMSWLLMDSVNQTEIALLCTSQELSWEMAKPLYENQIEFNYLEEELLESAVRKKGAIQVAGQEYSVLITDNRVSRDTQQLLKELEKDGVKVIHYHRGVDLPTLTEAYVTTDMRIQPADSMLRKTHVKKGKFPFIC